MNEIKRERIVVSVGGSLIVPDEVDTAFLKRFRELLLNKVGQGYSFYVITGGGKLARRYQEAADAILRSDPSHAQGTGLPRDDLDWLGIHSTRLNGHLLRTVFREQAHKELIKDPTQAVDTNEPIIVGAGWKPGWSTDYCAVLAAKTLGAKRVVNLSNIDYVYDKDPRKYKDAKKLEKVSWREFRKLIPSEWDPGLSSPFDPVAAKEAERLHLEVAIMNGSYLERLADYIDDEAFTGTVIS